MLSGNLYLCSSVEGPSTKRTFADLSKPQVVSSGKVLPEAGCLLLRLAKFFVRA